MGFSETTKSFAIGRQKGRCGLCGANFVKEDLLIEFHHINPISVSQDNGLENCVALCENCHREEAHVEGNTKGYVLTEDTYLYFNGRKSKETQKEHEMFGTDSYKTGFEQGVQDATSNQGKRLLPDLKTFFQSLFPGGDHLMSEYHKGYEEGYTKGLEKATNIYQTQQKASNSQNQEENTAKDSEKEKGINKTQQAIPNFKNPTAMANSFAQQIQVLEGLKAKLRDVQNYLETISGNYDAKVSGLEGEGFLRGVPYTALEDNLADTKSQISKLIDHIEHGDIAAIDKWISELEPLA